MKKQQANLENPKSCTVVIGYGVSGRATIEYLKSGDTNIVLITQRLDEISAKELLLAGVKVVIQDESFTWSEFLRTHEPLRIIVSPGISPYSKMMTDPLIRDIEVLTDIDLFFENLLKTNTSHLKAIGVTGTNGKTSVVELISFLLNSSGYRSRVAGNIGESPLSHSIDSFDFIVLELSSYQLFYAKKLVLHAAVLTSFSEDHLDWHKTLDHYKKSKMRILNLITKNDSPVVVSETCSDEFFHSGKPNNIFEVSELDRLNELSVFKNYSKIERLNVSLAITTVEQVIRRPLRDTELQTLENFRFPKFRNQFFLFPNSQRKLINDSKSTNLESTLVALGNLDHTVHLFIGGLAKNPDFSGLSAVAFKIAKISLFGKDGAAILDSLQGTELLKRATVYVSLREALEALKKEKDEESLRLDVLFSPGCASFDEFSGYSERGDFVVRMLNLSNPKL